MTLDQKKKKKTEMLYRVFETKHSVGDVPLPDICYREPLLTPRVRVVRLWLS